MPNKTKKQILKEKQRKKAKRKIATYKFKLRARAKEASLMYPTKNAELIAMFMRSNKTRGNYKDYVLFTGTRLVDWEGSIDCVDENDKPVVTEGTALVHKRNLKKFLTEEVAALFWSPAFGRQRRLRKKNVTV